MSSEYQGQDPMPIAKNAEQDLNSQGAKRGHELTNRARGGQGASDSTTESGIDESVTTKFPGATATSGSAASGGGDNRDIPESEGGGLNPITGQNFKAGDFEGEGGPEDNVGRYAEDQGGNDDVRGNIRQ